MKLIIGLCVAVMLGLPAGLAWPQDSAEILGEGGTESRLQRLEAEVLHLRNRVILLQERLDAVFGSEPGNKVHVIPVGDSPIRGEEEAPITLVEFGDYQSDYTVRAQHVIKLLLAEYPSRLRVVYMHFPLVTLHPLANEAALTTIAAEKQGLFWEMHDLLFRYARQLDSSLLLVLAQQVGLDLARLESDRNSLWALERLAADEAVATRVGVNGVPVMFLNGRRMASWRYDFLKAEIDKLLAAKR